MDVSSCFESVSHKSLRQKCRRPISQREFAHRCSMGQCPTQRSLRLSCWWCRRSKTSPRLRAVRIEVLRIEARRWCLSMSLDSKPRRPGRFPRRRASRCCKLKVAPHHLTRNDISQIYGGRSVLDVGWEYYLMILTDHQGIVQTRQGLALALLGRRYPLFYLEGHEVSVVVAKSLGIVVVQLLQYQRTCSLPVSFRTSKQQTFGRFLCAGRSNLTLSVHWHRPRSTASLGWVSGARLVADGVAAAGVVAVDIKVGRSTAAVALLSGKGTRSTDGPQIM